MPSTSQATDNKTLTIVFAKAPQPGVAKTRLIPLIGADGAARFHGNMIRHTLGTALNARIGPVELHCAPDTQDGFFRACAGRYRVTLYAQAGPDLGARMQRAFEQGLAAHRRVIIIGCDCPLLKTYHLREAHAALEHHDGVFVPAEDGGYALIGLTRCDPGLFNDIEWGGASVMASTRERLSALGWRWHELETLWDIDRPEDYQRWQALLREYAKPFRA